MATIEDRVLNSRRRSTHTFPRSLPIAHRQALTVSVSYTCEDTTVLFPCIAGGSVSVTDPDSSSSSCHMRNAANSVLAHHSLTSAQLVIQWEESYPSMPSLAVLCAERLWLWSLPECAVNQVE
jgi:hypothetical protein